MNNRLLRNKARKPLIINETSLSCFLGHCPTSDVVGVLTPRWSQRRLPLEFMDGLSYTTIIEFAESLAGRRGSALTR